MQHWNKTYADEARAIAAKVMDERGYHWKAEQIWRGKCDRDVLLETAMTALMTARGELECKKPRQLPQCRPGLIW